MNVQFRSAPSSAFVQPMTFAGRRPSTESKQSLRSADSKKERQSPTGPYSLVYQWVKMSLNLIREGKAEQRAERREAKHVARKGH